MVGNVWEWVDLEKPYDDAGAFTGGFIGGSYQSGANGCSAMSGENEPNSRNIEIGFRCCAQP
jgi:formylglycine-generating enzyme required for sulfatase activity